MKTIIVILSVILLAFTIIGIKYYDLVPDNPNSFFVTMSATLLGVLWAAVIGYLVWEIQHFREQKAERIRLIINLTAEIHANKTKLNELISYLPQLRKWASTLDLPDVKIKDLMISNDPEKGKHLTEILPYRQSTLATGEAVSNGTLTLLSEQLQIKIRHLSNNSRELNHIIDYCEKSSTDLIYTTVLVGCGASQQKRKSLIAYQAKSIIRFLSGPATELINLYDETLGLLEEKARRCCIADLSQTLTCDLEAPDK